MREKNSVLLFCVCVYYLFNMLIKGVYFLYLHCSDFYG